MNEKESRTDKRLQFPEIPTSITQEGEDIFQRIFGIPFKDAQELATWEGEVGERWRTIFKLIYDNRTQTNTGTDQAEHGGG